MFSGKDRCTDLCASRDVLRDVAGLGEMVSVACAVNPVEGKDEKNGAKQSEQHIG